jgi:hypothetical protein
MYTYICIYIFKLIFVMYELVQNSDIILHVFLCKSCDIVRQTTLFFTHVLLCKMQIVTIKAVCILQVSHVHIFHLCLVCFYE